ncbi:MAG: LacI family DNA-binding transcriptional regulator [Faecalibacterium sp.]|nr:LacI family DNA-binding transcriptional regulator [Faecalibacterium sp.]
MSLKDIAAEVGVSISTVSRVLNNEKTSAASKSLQAQIWEVARRQGYTPNAAARALKTTAPVEIPDVKLLYCMFACPPHETKDDPFFTKLTSAIEREAFKCGYILHYTFSSVDLDSPILLNTFAANPSDSLIILGRFDASLYRRVRKHFKKIVYVGLNRLDVKCDQVICDGFKAAQSAVEYLYSLGHRKIGYVGCQEARMHGFLHALNSLGLPTDARLLSDDSELSMEGGYQGMLRLLDKAPDITAVFCGNDITAIGALRAAKDRGLKLPRDLSIIGVNNIENVQYTSPMLASINVPLEEMGKTAVHVLLDRIEGCHSSNIVVEFPSTVVKRESCSLPPV